MTSSEIINNWKNYFVSQGIDQETIDYYLAYVSTLVKNNVPIILDVDHFALLIGVDRSEINKITFSTESFYREFSIQKKRGGERLISVPYPTLSFIQKWIKNEILDKALLNECAHGFVQKKSVITNARIHLGQSKLLKMDIKDFFPSINRKRVINVFQKFGYSNNVSFFLASMCIKDDKLPQGGATSPSISNIVAKKFDYRLTKLSERYKLKYTRYADDLTFSGNYIPSTLIDLISKILIEEGFNPNNEKTRLISGQGKKIITGISVGSNVLKLPKSKKRSLRQEGYYLTKHPNQILNKMIKDPFYIDRVIGRYNFWLQVEPENKFALNTIKMLKNISSTLTQTIEK